MARDLSILRKDPLGSVNQMAAFARQALEKVSEQASDAVESSRRPSTPINTPLKGAQTGTNYYVGNNGTASENRASAPLNRGTQVSANGSYEAGPSFFNEWSTLANDGAIWDSIFNRLTGAGLTGEQVAQMGFEEYMSNTSYQRQVADMRAAGLNPALLYGNGAGSGASTPSATNGSNGLEFSDLVQMLLLPTQLAQMQSVIDLNKSQGVANIAAAKESGARAAELHASELLKGTENSIKQLQYSFDKETYETRKEVTRISKERAEVDLETARELKKKVPHEIDLLIEQAFNEHEQGLLAQAKRAYEDASTREINALLPCKKLLLSAQEYSARMAGKASEEQAGYFKEQAGLTTIQSAIQEGLLESGWVEGQINLLYAQVQGQIDSNQMKELQTKMEQLKQKIVNGEAISVDDIEWYRPVDRITAKRYNEMLQRMYELSVVMTGATSSAVNTAATTATTLAK